MPVGRSVTVPLEPPPLLQVADRAEVIFRGCVPERLTALRQATWPSMTRRVGPDTMIVKGIWHTPTRARTNEFGAWGPFID